MSSSNRCLKMLDVGCGRGGMSNGFAAEGFDVTGIDIVDAPKLLGYPYKFIQGDIRKLDGSQFRGFDVIHGSMPCRNFSIIAKTLGQYWKNPPNIEAGLELVNAFTKFVEDAQPTYWIMENVHLLKDHYTQPVFIAPLGKAMRRGFWGNFPPFLMPRTNKVLTAKMANGKMTHFKCRSNHAKDSWIRAEIPIACSQAFAKACREALEQPTECVIG